MNIGIIGTGSIGGNLARAWGSKGHQIILGTRDAQSSKITGLLSEIGANARAATPAEAAAAGEIVVLALPSSTIHEMIAQLGDLSGKIIVDPTNYFSAPAKGGASGAEEIARLTPGAHVVKVFNTIPAELLLNPVVAGQSVTTFVAADDPAARQRVIGLAAEIGFDAVDTGTLANAGALEGMLKVFIALSQHYGREIGFKLLRQ